MPEPSRLQAICLSRSWGDLGRSRDRDCVRADGPNCFYRVVEAAENGQVCLGVPSLTSGKADADDGKPSVRFPPHLVGEGLG